MILNDGFDHDDDDDDNDDDDSDDDDDDSDDDDDDDSDDDGDDDDDSDDNDHGNDDGDSGGDIDSGSDSYTHTGTAAITVKVEVVMKKVYAICNYKKSQVQEVNAHLAAAPNQDDIVPFSCKPTAHSLLTLSCALFGLRCFIHPEMKEAVRKQSSHFFENIFHCCDSNVLLGEQLSISINLLISPRTTKLFVVTS